MDASSSSHPALRGPQPATPSHPSLLPALSPSSALEQTPAPLHSLPPHLQHPHSVHSRPGSAQSSHIAHPQSHAHHGPPIPQPQFVLPGGHVMQPPQSTERARAPAGAAGANNGNVFGNVMGSGPGQGPVEHGPAHTKVYASVYSGIAVFEAMIRGISVMRRSHDSWVNATQILKVAGIPKSSRTKILEKEILVGLHEKVQGGYGKYQGTWIPLQRGHELAAQYGVTSYLSPIFDMELPSGGVAALPVARPDGHDRQGGLKTPSAIMGYNPDLTPSRMASPYGHMPPPPQYSNGGDMMMMPPGVYPPYYAQPDMSMTPTRNQPPDMNAMLAPAADIGAMGLPPSHSDVYIDQYGQPHPNPHYAQQYTIADDLPPPAKRQRSDEGDFANGDNDGDFLPEVEEAIIPTQQTEEEEQDGIEDEEDSEDEELRNASPLPGSFRLSTKPLRPKLNQTTARTRDQLIKVFGENAGTVDLQQILKDAHGEDLKDVDVDIVIDDQGHTALHWATALAVESIPQQLIDLGADIHRGNYAGETPLIRSVLTTNHAESGRFSDLLTTLSGSIRTLDHAHRSVIHHIALIAGVKGRAASARAYMAGVLEWVAKNGLDGDETGQVSLKNLVDLQDVHGDTALNIAARVGSKALIQLLLDAGADKARANKLGLKPFDFGVEVELLKLSPGEAVVSTLKAEVPRPARRSRDVQKNISAIFETINNTFAQEMTIKQTKLNDTETKVRHATKSLADKRQQVARAQAALGDLEQVKQKIENAKKALGTLPSQDWTGRGALSSEMSGETVAPAGFRHVQVGNVAFGSGEEIALPPKGSDGAVARLRRIAAWEDRIAQIIQDRLAALEGESADKAVKYRRLVSMCTKVPIERVDGLLDNLTQAIESDGSSIDLGRVNGLLARADDAKPGSGQSLAQPV